MSTKPRSTSAARKPIRIGGQYTKNTSPMMFLGTAPHSRESQDCTRLSPMKKYRPSGSSAGRACSSRGEFRGRRAHEPLAVDVDDAVALLPRLAGQPDESLDERSPGAALRLGCLRRLEDDDVAACRLAQVVDEAVREHAVGEARSQPELGRAQCSVGSIEDDGIRYGFTTHALIASTMAMAPMIVTAQSMVTRSPGAGPWQRRTDGLREFRARSRRSRSIRSCSLSGAILV